MNTAICNHSPKRHANNRIGKSYRPAFLNSDSVLFPKNTILPGSALLFILGGLAFALVLGLIYPQSTQALENTLSSANDTPANDTPITITIQVEGFSENIPVL